LETKYYEEDKQLIFLLHEEIDDSVTKNLKRKMDYEIERFLPKKVLIDLENVGFMDSAGIGLIIGRYKLINMIGGELKILNASMAIKKIFNMSGISRLIPIEETSNL
jgi:stage II sporulation protein AA (anti-sigma F factor antagonist)